MKCNATLLLWLLPCALTARIAVAQDMEPRRWTHLPVEDVWGHVIVETGNVRRMPCHAVGHVQPGAGEIERADDVPLEYPVERHA